MFVFCLTGLFADELAIHNRYSPFDTIFTGWPKQLFCASGLLLSTMILYVFIGAIAVKLSLFARVEQVHGFIMTKLWFVLMGISVAGFFIAGLWQDMSS